MSEKSFVPVYLIIGHLSKYCDFKKKYAMYCFIPIRRRYIFRSIDILHMHALCFMLKTFVK